MSEWQPIETAPKDGTLVLVSIPPENELVEGYCVVASCNDDWSAAECAGTDVWGWIEPAPTHWMPLPAPPEPR